MRVASERRANKWERLSREKHGEIYRISIVVVRMTPITDDDDSKTLSHSVSISYRLLHLFAAAFPLNFLLFSRNKHGGSEKVRATGAQPLSQAQAHQQACKCSCSSMTASAAEAGAA